MLLAVEGDPIAKHATDSRSDAVSLVARGYPALPGWRHAPLTTCYGHRYPALNEIKSHRPLAQGSPVDSPHFNAKLN